MSTGWVLALTRFPHPLYSVFLANQYAPITRYMFSRAFHRLHFFPAPAVCYLFSRVPACLLREFPIYHQIETCFGLWPLIFYLVQDGFVYVIPHFPDRLSDYCGFGLMTVVIKPCTVMTGRTNVDHCTPERFFDCAIYRIRVPLIRDQCFEEEI